MGDKGRNRATRRYNRLVKGIRRIKEDRQEHGNQFGGQKFVCSCFDEDADKGRGAVFARFADHPKVCSRPSCCGNPRRKGAWGTEKTRLTIQEQRAPKAIDWD